MSSSANSHFARNLTLLVALVALIGACGTCIAAVGLIPLFGQWLFPHAPPVITDIATVPASPTLQPALVVVEVRSDQDWQEAGISVQAGDTVLRRLYIRQMVPMCRWIWMSFCRTRRVDFAG